MSVYLLFCLYVAVAYETGLVMLRYERRGI